MVFNARASRTQPCSLFSGGPFHPQERSIHLSNWTVEQGDHELPLTKFIQLFTILFPQLTITKHPPPYYKIDKYSLLLTIKLLYSNPDLGYSQSPVVPSGLRIPPLRPWTLHVLFHTGSDITPETGQLVSSGRALVCLALWAPPFGCIRISRPIIFKDSRITMKKGIKKYINSCPIKLYPNSSLLQDQSCTRGCSKMYHLDRSHYLIGMDTGQRNRSSDLHGSQMPLYIIAH